MHLYTTWYREGTDDLQELRKLADVDKATIEKNMAALSSQGLRVWDFATRYVDCECDDPEKVESNLTFQSQKIVCYMAANFAIRPHKTVDTKLRICYFCDCFHAFSGRTITRLRYCVFKYTVHTRKHCNHHPMVFII